MAIVIGVYENSDQNSSGYTPEAYTSPICTSLPLKSTLQFSVKPLKHEMQSNMLPGTYCFNTN